MPQKSSLLETSIEKIVSGSIAEEVGMKIGDQVLAINDQEIEDALDFQYKISLFPNRLTIKLLKSSGELWNVEIEKEEEEDLGLELGSIQTRICDNNCIFCFVHQLPRGKQVRRTLRIKDEDFRLSFLFGHYLTLTNLSEKDFQRIFEQRLSPLYVSVHATDPKLRKYLLQNTKPDNLLKNIDRLIKNGIKLHTQIVLIPEINDGLNLEKSIQQLLQFYPKVITLSIIPVGLTDHRQGLPKLKSVDAKYAQKTIHHVSKIQREIKQSHGTPFCFLGDEFYILAGEKIPPRSHYGDFPLVENGVGMVRNFIDDFQKELVKPWEEPIMPIQGTIVTGRIFFPILNKYINKMNKTLKINLRCIAVDNHYFGKGINVAGLLTGQDIFTTSKNQLYGDFLVVPSESMTGSQNLFLDNWTCSDLEKHLGVPVWGGGFQVSEFFNSIFLRIHSKNSVPVI